MTFDLETFDPDAAMSRMMQQYRDAKTQHPGMLVLFRNGDFYELFEDDAELGSRVLGITLTKRDGSIPMAGVPVHKLEHYLGLLLRAGHRVAVCEQMEEPDPKKKIIPREVNRIVTPGTITDDGLLDPRAPNYLVALVPAAKAGVYGIAWVDLSTGYFSAADVPTPKLSDELSRLNAVECLFADALTNAVAQAAGMHLPRSRVARPDWTFDPSTALAALKTHFAVSTFTGFGFEDAQPGLVAAGAVIIYLQETLKASLQHIRRLRPHRPDTLLALDEVTRRSLELTRTLRDNQRDGSLLSVLDRTVTPMGARLLHDSVLAPLTDRPAINARLDAVEELLKDHALRRAVREHLEACSDIQRLTTRVSTAKAGPRDLSAIARTLRKLPAVKAKLTGRRSPLLQELEKRLELCPDIRELLDKAIEDDPPHIAKEGGVIRAGFSAELDELRALTTDGKNWIARYQAQEITRTGIGSLKVGYNEIDGYYLEITNANETKTPAEYKHQKTLKNAKRYYTPALREYEEKVVTAQDKSRALELQLFLTLRDQVAAQTPRLLNTAEVLAALDMLSALAELAAARNYVRPVLVDEPILDIRDGRHPVLDQILPPGTFVPNDAAFGPDDGTFWLVTGPNMAGKSTFLRQVALITLMAHMGSLVPAKSATIGMTDRIFTRVGASDELSRGQSTFMVEMTEAANILNNATPRSLVILDEIGRGTATYDGVSLAWAMTEYLHDAIGCRSLFATHYHELAQLATALPRLRNYNVLVRELADEIVFLHKIAPGNAERSYGIHVARLAGVPDAVLKRATAVLSSLEKQHELPGVSTPSVVTAPALGTTPVVSGDLPPRKTNVVQPPEAPRRKPKPQPSSPSLFGEGEDVPF
ncbi:dna mismatch repair protein : DNA mismatch repair protein MutS OS=Singulisphaera acidiphila (strain ATCC BAA-1392 / DSM 18658 / VKM B-2454 / MOB10) GN=mutS PE=3 SV=1: MutS_I: MutS_II: MutS_III: MutS_IV: MutS_V [Gemmata massiliana]|uniref:DNA mismatch repair protein MutS n=1 Tax=Gemmata massiliana TaxID=1210884 RepID=A0A6P2D2B1_9BACT|nr:DNA mismatch repair protein MutS [Gemmata massiliana]VTR94535.1 dna mismatch repair protein : DNA mismatch repair protein MutS OS=Singulisphaera acidiphila (strain ATCC BAA-1392 / DSM 18658 / VKM B-2454 / MOB10) GN=mutS PE=3 SV=1: MutS_I: MutS_II: MutS_III: MutS_IV: MutS_V [Gemmata massiliana]